MAGHLEVEYDFWCNNNLLKCIDYFPEEKEAKHINKQTKTQAPSFHNFILRNWKVWVG